MKNRFNISHIILLSLSLLSCIREDLSECPYYGLYRVSFTDSLKNTGLFGGHTTICYTQKESKTGGQMQFKLHPDSTLLTPRHTYRLAPGTYSFNALFSADTAESTLPVILKNGIRYMYASTLRDIEKKGNNNIPLIFSPANSMIAVKFHLRHSGYDIKLAEITPPEEKNALLNFNTGLCSHETEVSGFYIKCTHDITRDMWSTYCNPLSANNYIHIRATLYDKINKKIIILDTREYIRSNINQGETYILEADVTPQKLRIISGKIEKWKEIGGGTVIISGK
jgi:hypothetical protein